MCLFVRKSTRNASRFRLLWYRAEWPTLVKRGVSSQHLRNTLHARIVRQPCMCRKHPTQSWRTNLSKSRELGRPSRKPGPKTCKHSLRFSAMPTQFPTTQSEDWSCVPPQTATTRLCWSVTCDWKKHAFIALGARWCKLSPGAAYTRLQLRFIVNASIMLG